MPLGKVVVVNVISTCTLGKRLPLASLGGLEGFEYDPKKYHGKVAYFKNHHIEGKLSVFNSGKIISVGAKSELSSRRNMQHLEHILRLNNLIKKGMSDFKVQNIVASVDLGMPIEMVQVVGRIQGVVYEPEQFPGAMFYLPKLSHVSVLLFSTGKAVLAGIKSEAQVPLAVKELYEALGA
jgi:transcription initiation factor TFIID TATA-box-binding protein